MTDNEVYSRGHAEGFNMGVTECHQWLLEHYGTPVPPFDELTVNIAGFLREMADKMYVACLDDESGTGIEMFKQARLEQEYEDYQMTFTLTDEQPLDIEAWKEWARTAEISPAIKHLLSLEN